VCARASNLIVKTFPSCADYIAAVESAGIFVLDPVLKRGRPRTDRNGQPLIFAGGFTRVFVIDCVDKTYALRCWISDIGDAAHHYHAVADCLDKAHLPYFAHCAYEPEGILVNGVRYPTLRMEWVEALTAYSSGNLDREYTNLATFGSLAGDTCQGLVHFPAEPRRQTFYPDRWFRTVERLSLARSGIPGCEVSLRTSLRGSELDQLAFFHAPAAAEERLRYFLASFFELLAWTDGSVILPLDRASHDRLAEPWTRHLCRIEHERYTVGNAWLVCDFRTLDFLPELLDEAAALGHDILHQANLQAFRLSPEHERRARPTSQPLSPSADFRRRPSRPKGAS
jgi:hypothetical protein